MSFGIGNSFTFWFKNQYLLCVYYISVSAVDIDFLIGNGYQNQIWPSFNLMKVSYIIILITWWYIKIDLIIAYENNRSYDVIQILLIRKLFVP